LFAQGPSDENGGRGKVIIRTLIVLEVQANWR